ncbi:formyl transferase [Candidatus Aerophobetes bacterium]|nr:formyl transferase [Candidatus Aerophobetes bacterium]
MTFKIGWFSTGRDKQARLLLQESHEAAKQGKIGDASISYVFSNSEREENKESDKFIDLVNRLGIAFVSFSSTKFKSGLRKKGLKDIKSGNFELINRWRALYDREIVKKVQEYPAEAIFLAGYMLILGEKICEKFPILNLHPALPCGPKGTWQEVIWQLIEKKERESGIMIHRVTCELDAGPAITYCKFSLRGEMFDPLWKKMQEKLKHKTLTQIKKEEGEKEPLFKAIREEQKKREIPLVISTLHLLGEAKINLQNLKGPLLVEI